MTPTNNPSPEELKRLQAKSKPALIEQIERIGKQMVMAYQEKDDAKYRELATRQGEVIAALITKK